MMQVASFVWLMMVVVICSGQTALPLGCIYPLSATTENGVMQQIIDIAVQEVNNQQIIPNNYVLSVQVRDTQMSERTATQEVYRMMQNDGVLGIIGDSYSATSVSAQRIASIFNGPQISSATDDALSNRAEFPTFLRIVPPNSVQASVLVQLIKSFKWNRVAIVYTSDPYGVGLLTAFTAAAKDLNIVIEQAIDIDVSDISKEIEALGDVSKDATILFSLATHAVRIIAEASKQELIGEGQVWIGSDGVMRLTPSHFTDSNAHLSTSMNGFIGTFPTASGSGNQYNRFVELMTQYNISAPLGAISFYDACFVYAAAFKTMIEAGAIPEGRLDLFQRDQLFSVLAAISPVEGASGTISFGSTGSANIQYDVLNWQKGEGYKVLGKWNGGAPPPVVFVVPPKGKKGISKVGLAFAVILPVLALAAIAFGIKKYIDRERILWLAETWDDEEFDEGAFWDEAMNLEVGGLTVDKKQLNFDLPHEARFPIDMTLTDTITLTNNFPSAVNFKIYAPRNEGKFTCKIFPGHGTVAKGESKLITIQMTLLCTTDVAHFIKVEVPGFENRYTCVQMAFEGEICDRLDPDELEITDTLGKGGFGTVYKGTYRGAVVAIKTMNAQSDWVDPELVSEFQRELALLRKLKHPNVVSFVACSLVPKKLCLAIEFCENGELRSYLKKHKGMLTPAFKLRILLDVAKGMAFLHSNGVFHRDIKPDNILLVSDNIEAAVVAKINDFGTARALALHQINQPINHTKCIGTPVYMAPELYLIQPYNNKVDVYSFGILMWEVLTEQMPFYFVDKPWDVYNYVTAGKKNPIPQEYPPAVKGLIQTCWAQQPNERPAFPEIVALMEELYKQSLTNNNFMAPAGTRFSASNSIVRALQGVKKKRFPTLARAKTTRGGVVVNISDC